MPSKFANGIDTGGARVQGVGAPSAPTDASRKADVDAVVSRLTARAPQFVKQSTPVFTRAQSPWAVSANEKLYWPWVIDAKSVYPQASAQFYMYYSTDHASGVGGIGVATANSPLGPWTDLGTKMYVDTTSGTSQTETPSVVWNAEAGLFYMYYQQKTSVTDQSTLLATSPNGITNWTRVGVVITTPGDVRAGDGHSGYARVFRHGNIWIAHHLAGGMSRAHYGTSYSRDGLTWNTDPRAIAGQVSLWGDGLTKRGADHIGVSPFWWKGRMWAAMQHGPYVAGTESDGKQILLGLYDGPFDYWVYSEMLKPGQYAWDLNSVYQPHVMPYGDKLYLYFLTDGADLNGAVGCAVAEAA